MSLPLTLNNLGVANGTDWPVSPEVEEFVQNRSFYYVGIWHKLDETLKHRESGTFNWSACVLGPYWMLYRKMYGYAIALLGSTIVLDILLYWVGMSFLSIGLTIGIRVSLGHFGNAIYKRHVLARLNGIPRNLPDHLRLQAIRHKGGVSLLGPFLWLLSMAGIVVLSSM